MIVTAVMCSSLVEADVVYSTFAPGDVFNLSGGAAINNGQWVANQFTVTGNDYQFGQLEIAGGCIASIGPNEFDLSIRADNAGLPGTIMESFTVSLPVSFTDKLSVNSTTHPLLEDGSSYWVVLGSSTNAYGWWSQNGDIHSIIATSGDGGSSFTANEGENVNMYRVYGTVVPEPSELMLVFTGLCALAGTRAWECRRKRNG
jgi:hypothetical protein